MADFSHRILNHFELEQEGAQYQPPALVFSSRLMLLNMWLLETSGSEYEKLYPIRLQDGTYNGLWTDESDDSDREWYDHGIVGIRRLTARILEETARDGSKLEPLSKIYPGLGLHKVIGFAVDGPANQSFDARFYRGNTPIEGVPVPPNYWFLQKIVSTSTIYE